MTYGFPKGFPCPVVVEIGGGRCGLGMSPRPTPAETATPIMNRHPASAPRRSHPLLRDFVRLACLAVLALPALRAAEAPAPVPPPEPPAVPKTATNNGLWNVSLISGARLQNPYSIENGLLKPNNSTTDGFIELSFNHLFVNTYKAKKNEFKYQTDERNKPRSTSESKEYRGQWHQPFRHIPDLDFRVGYVFGGQSTPNEITQSTLVGGSDIYGESSIGLPFWRHTDLDSSGDSPTWFQQATLEFSGGFVTDKKALDIHPNYFVGVGHQLSDGAWTWTSRLGLGGIDIPEITTGNTVVVGGDGLPEYANKAALTSGTRIFYKLSEGTSIQLAANVYFGDRPTWNLSAGVSLNPGKIFEALKK
jgi:hypothetical protein